MKKKLDQILSYISRIYFEEYVCVVVIVLLTILLLLQVFMRFFLGTSIASAEELSRYCLLILVYFSSSIAIRNKSHIRLSGHLQKMPKIIQLLFKVISEAVWLFFNITIIVSSFNLLGKMSQRPMVSGALQINMSYIYILIPIAFIIHTIRLIISWFTLSDEQNQN